MECDPRVRSLACLLAEPLRDEPCGLIDDRGERHSVWLSQIHLPGSARRSRGSFVYTAWPSLETPFIVVSTDPVRDRLTWFSSTPKRAVAAKAIHLGVVGTRFLTGGQPLVCRLFSEATGRDCLSASVLNGVAGGGRRPSLVLLDDRGYPVGFGRCAYGRAEAERLGDEEAVLRQLRQDVHLSANIPHLLGRLAVNGIEVMVTEACDTRVRKRRLDAEVVAFQRRLSSHYRERVAVDECHEVVCARRALETFVLPEKFARAGELLLASLAKYKGSSCWTGLQHGDFVWWNMGQKKSGGLFVFDWEQAGRNSAISNDFFHFMCMPAVLSGASPTSLWKASRIAWSFCEEGSVPSTHCAFVLYLTGLWSQHVERWLLWPEGRTVVLERLTVLSKVVWKWSQLL